MATKEIANNDSGALANLLAEGTPLARKGQSESTANLLRASDHVLMAGLSVVQESLALLFAKTAVPVPDTLGDTMKKCKDVISSVGLISYKQERRDAGNFDMDQELICELYDMSGPEFTETKFKLSEAKNLPSFSGLEENIAVSFESFVKAVANHGKAAKLNSAGLASLLLNKIVGSAARILTSSLVLRDIKEEDLDTPRLMTICESLFMSSCSVKQSKLQLTQLKPLADNSIAFTELQANLVRLVQLSVRDIHDKAERDTIFKCRTQDYFNNLIPPRPRAFLTEHNTQRLRSGLENLSLAASVVFLNEKFSSEKTDALISQEVKRQSSSINRVDQGPSGQYLTQEEGEGDGNWGDYEYALMTRSGGRGANRARGRGRDDFGKQGYPKFSANQGAPIIPGNLRGAPTPPDWRGRGRGGVPGGGAPPRGGGAPRQGQPRLNFTPTPSLFGIAPRSCWGCGDPTHRVGQDACYYKASALQQTKCSGCHMGGHLRSECAGPNQRAIQALREHVKTEGAQMWQAGRGRGAAPASPARGRGAAPRGVGRGDGRGRLNPRRQVHKVTDDPKFEDINEDPFEEYLADLENQDF